MNVIKTIELIFKFIFQIASIIVGVERLSSFFLFVCFFFVRFNMLLLDKFIYFFHVRILKFLQITQNNSSILMKKK